ncbi:uncharacterized protein NPIL_548411 [Nephila pilipes]|uniref:Uncharacterized protein n=1 Tax=Nephila pilipes TaxID=299642 RepID=A0A8X6PWJ6_NEPPI|nr:uncharacterized protein NPIL_548411 [Nephila pilipes]
MADQKTQREHITQITKVMGKVKASMTRLKNTAEDLMLKNEILIRLQRPQINLVWRSIAISHSLTQANLTNLRNIVDTSDEIMRALKDLGNEATNRDPWLIQLLLQKLDPETIRLWSVKTSDREFPTWEEFWEFLNTRSSSLEMMVYD